MEGVEIHTTSPVSSDSSKNSPNQLQKPVAAIRPSLATMHKTSWTSYMIREDPEPSSSFSSSASGSGPGSGPGSSAAGDTSIDALTTTNRKDSTTDPAVEHVSLAPESTTQDLTTQTPAYNATTLPTPAATFPSTQTTNPHRRSSTRIHTRTTSISATMDLPWKIDNTSSSPYTPTSHRRSSSFGIPPPPKAGEMSRNSSSSSYSSDSTADSPKLHPLMTRVATSANLAASPSPYATHQAPSPYGSTSTTMSTSTSGFNFDFPSQTQHHNRNQDSFSSQYSQPTSYSLNSPPGYTQNPTSFPIPTPQINTHQPPTPLSITTQTTGYAPSPSRRDSSSYSPHDTTPAPLYTSNTSPLYQNTTSNNNSYGYNSTLFSPSFSFAPKTPTPKKVARAGILDNDPSMYLTSDDGVEEDSIWDAATKWVRSTSKKMSFGGENMGGSGSAGGGMGIGMALGSVSGSGRSGDYSLGNGLWKMVAGGGGGSVAGAGPGARAGGGGLSNAY